MKVLVYIGFVISMAVPVMAVADSGGRMGGYENSGLPAASGRARTPEEIAISAYNDGVELRDEAVEYEAEAEAATDDIKKQEKLLKKAQKSYTKAAEKFEKAVKNNPELYQAWSGFGHALRKTGDYERSLEAYRSALALEPNYHEAIEYQAEAFMHLGQYENVKTAYAKLRQEKLELAGKLLREINKWLRGQDLTVANADLKAFAQWAKDMNGA
jgi:tetratricopeptide (TPR) repeat protein